MAKTMALYWLAVIFMVNFALKVSSQNITKTSQQVVDESKTAFDLIKDQTLSKLNALLAVNKDAQTLFWRTGLDVGDRLTYEYYLEGTQGLQGTADYIRLKDVVLAVTTDNIVRNLPGQAETLYKACLALNGEISTLAKTESAIREQIMKVGTTEVGFKVAVGACNVVKPELAQGCVDNVWSKYVLPAVNQSVVNGLSLIKGNAKCIEEAAAKVKSGGQLGVESVRKVISKDALFMVPEKYDLLEGRVFGQPTEIVTPSDKLSKAKVALFVAKKKLEDAWNAKDTNFVSAKTYLNDLFTELSGNLQAVPLSSDASLCLTIGKANTNGNQNVQGSALLECTNNIKAVATPQDLSTLVLSLVDRETKESVGASTVNCFKSLRNVFFPSELQCCMTEALDDYSVFLDSVTAKAKLYSKRADEITAQFEQCKLSAMQAAKKQFFNDAGTFEKCIKQRTKVTFSSGAPYPFVVTPV